MDPQHLLTIFEMFNLGLLVRVVPEHNTAYVRLKYWRAIDADTRTQTCLILCLFCLKMQSRPIDNPAAYNLTLTVRVWPNGRELLTWDYYAEEAHIEEITARNEEEITFTQSALGLKLLRQCPEQ